MRYSNGRDVTSESDNPLQTLRHAAVMMCAPIHKDQDRCILFIICLHHASSAMHLLSKVSVSTSHDPQNSHDPQKSNLTVGFNSMQTPPDILPRSCDGLLKWAFEYLKPVQTGFPADSDARLVVSPSV